MNSKPVTYAMSDAEARQFESFEIQFGKHKGRQVHEIPLDYLLWLDEQPDFRIQLRKYLGSDRVQKQLE